MILLLGASGYFGRAFAGELRRRGHAFIPLKRRVFDYTRFDFLFDYLRRTKPVFLINAANYCGQAASGGGGLREQAMAANAVLPQMIARVCLMTKTPWGHVSSGCIYSGCKVVEDGQERIEKDLGRPEIRKLFVEDPERLKGFTEEDRPNFSFHQPPCSFYSGTKALAEEAIREIAPDGAYLWRMRMPFNEKDEICNLLRHPPESVDDAPNSLSHREDCVKACLDLWEARAPFGIYNVTNPGAAAVRSILEGVARFTPGHGTRSPEHVVSPLQVPRANCILDVSKLLQCGIKIRPVNDALEQSLAGLQAILRGGRPPSPQ
jgi:dTDP-4-dehydrorhamnose reductase